MKRQLRVASPRLALALCAALAPLGALAAYSHDPAAPLDYVTLQLKWTHQFQFAGYYAAIQQGYYRDAGLSVRLIEAQPDIDPVATVLSGKADFGVGTSELVLLRAKGDPVVVLAAIYQHSPLVLLALRTPGADDLQAIAAKPMMIEPQSAELYAYFRNEGVNLAKLTIRPHTFDVQDLIAGHVAAMSAYSTDEPFVLKEAGIDYLTFTPRAGGIDFYGDNLFTTEKEIHDHPARVSAFRQASLRGWEYALAHQTEMVDLILRDYGRRKSREHLLFEAGQTAALMHADLIEVGHMNPGRWRHIADTYAEFGMLPRNFSLEGFLYDPAPHPNLRLAYITACGLGIVALAALGWALPLVQLNRKLRRAKEAAEAANAVKSRYLAVMNDEIRTPMNGILGLAALLLDGPLEPELRDSLRMITDATRTLLKQVNDLLDWSEVAEGRVRLEQTPLALAEFLQDLVSLFLPAAEAKGLSLSQKIADSVPPVIVTDPLRLRQILVNLVANAITSTSQGSVELSVELRPGPPPEIGGILRLLFHVRDTGAGIPAAALGHVFEPYVQSEGSAARHFRGAGLGLSISQGLAKLLGGAITVTSREGSGSYFTVEIAARREDPSTS